MLTWEYIIPKEIMWNWIRKVVLNWLSVAGISDSMITSLKINIQDFKHTNEKSEWNMELVISGENLPIVRR